MKKILTVLLLALMLAGCGNAGEQTVPPSMETIRPAESGKTCYVPGSAMERSTGGAVKLYQMDGSVKGLGMLGENLVVCVDGARLELLDPQTMQTLRTRALESGINWQNSSLTLTGSGLGYFDAGSKTYVTLDENLVTASTYEMDEEITGEPVMASDASRIYFATEEGIRVMTVSEGTSRLLREEHDGAVELGGLLLDDSVLYYTRKDRDGTVQTCFVDGENGSLYTGVNFQGDIRSWGDQYGGLMTIAHAMGQSEWLISGTLTGETQRLSTSFDWDSAVMLADGRAVLQKSSQMGLSLYCCDVTTGELVAQITMPEQYDLMNVGCAGGEKIWLCDGTSSRFYCWDTSFSGKTQDKCALVSYRALDAGDQEGLAQCRKLAQTIGGRYGVEIVLQEGDNRTTGEDYTDFPDVRPEQYNQALRELERILKRLPDGFLANVGREADSGLLRICLVDDYDPAAEATPSIGSMDVADGKLEVRVNMCPALSEIFCHELFHVLEVQIRNAGDALNDWEQWNPEGFAYENSYFAYASGALADSPYLKEENRAFADGYSLVSAREDRAQMFVYACMDDQRERFESEAMQGKLLLLCQTLRAHFQISGEEAPLWEQYLAAGATG